MEKRTFFALGFVIFIVTPCFAHMCHDPFRPKEHLVLTPEKEIIRIEETGEFRMYIENTFRSALSDVRLLIESQAFDIEVKPQVITRLAPGERNFFLIRLKLRKGFKPETYPLRIGVEARSAELKPSIEKMIVAIEKKKPDPEIEQEETVPFEEESAPTKEEVLPIEEKSEKKPLPPAAEEVVKPQEEKVEVQQEEVVVRVEKIPFWQRPYFYLILILFLVGILLWRKLK